MTERPEYCLKINCPFYSGVCLQARQISRNVVGRGSVKKKEERTDKLNAKSQTDPQGLIGDCQKLYENYF